MKRFENNWSRTALVSHSIYRLFDILALNTYNKAWKEIMYNILEGNTVVGYWPQ